MMSNGLLQITFTTLATAALSTALILPFGIALAWVLARREWRGKSLVETFVALPLVAPPIVTGLILLKLFGRKSILGGFFENTLGIEIVFTWRAIVLATAVISFPLLVRTARVAFENIPVRYEQVAHSLGASARRVFFTITLPLASRGLLAGALLAFARALGEFGATLMVAGYMPETHATLSLAIYHNVQLGRDNVALTMLCVSLAIAFAAVFLSEFFVRHSRSSNTHAATTSSRSSR